MTMVKKSITVTSQQAQWIEEQVASGHYGNDSEIIREALREKQMRQAEIEFIRGELIKAEASGYTERTPEEIREEAKARLRREGRI